MGLQVISNNIDGYAVTSLNEALLSRDVLGRNGIIHLSTPALLTRDIERLTSLCDCISFNSISQLVRFRQRIRNKCRIGLRVNPGKSYVKDERYNPCRKHSKLGVSVIELCRILRDEPKIIEDVTGLLFHTLQSL